MAYKNNPKQSIRTSLGVNISKLMGQARNLRNSNPARYRQLRKQVESYGYSV